MLIMIISNGVLYFLSGVAIILVVLKLKMDNSHMSNGQKISEESISPLKWIGGEPTFAKMNGNPENLLLWPQPLQSIGVFHDQEPNWISSTAGFPAVPVRPSLWRRSAWTALQDPITTNGAFPISRCMTYLIEKPMPNGLKCDKNKTCAEGLVCNSDNICI